MANLILGIVEGSHTKFEGVQALQTQFCSPFTDGEKGDIVFRSFGLEISPLRTSSLHLYLPRGWKRHSGWDILACFCGQ